MVRVTWLDAWVDQNEVAFSDITDGLKVCRDHGIMVKKTKTAVVIAQSDAEDNILRYITSIPMVLVIKIEEVTGLVTTYEKKRVKNAKEDGTGA